MSILDRFSSRTRWCLIVLLGLLLLAGTTPVFAQDDQPAGDRPCASCHPAEADAWEVSPHALSPDPGATCRECHGDYVRGHPDEGMEPLTVDSSACADCHGETVAQWQGTVHAEANVQCIGCHMSHSQDLRLTDDRLCVSCHQEPVQNSFHAAHWYGDVACTECHMAEVVMPTRGQRISTDPFVPADQPAMGELVTINHDFTSVAADSCVACHTGGAGAVTFKDDPLLTELRTTQEQVVTLKQDLSETKTENRSLGQWLMIALGIGLGMGGFLGIAVTLLLAYVSRREVPHVS